MSSTHTAALLRRAMGDRSTHQASVAWGINWHTLHGYLEGKIPNRESMIRVLAFSGDIDEAALREAIAEDLARSVSSDV